MLIGAASGKKPARNVMKDVSERGEDAERRTASAPNRANGFHTVGGGRETLMMLERER